MSTDRLWVTWETQRRNEELAGALGAELLVVDLVGCGRLSRYVRSALVTLRVLRRRSYGTVFAQCPSVALVTFLSLARPFFGFRLVIDAHNGALDYLTSSNLLLAWLSRYAFRHAAVVIVSNDELKPRLQGVAQAVVVLSDKLPELSPKKELPLLRNQSRPFVVLVSTFASDEPLGDFLEAAQRSSMQFTLFVTGKRSRAGELLRYESPHIIFTDFLEREAYDALIRQADLVVDLTTREACLVCGAYEAVSAARPLLLSRTSALESYFTMALFTDNTVSGHEAALIRFFGASQDFADRMKAGVAEIAERWAEELRNVESSVQAIERGQKSAV